MGLLRALSGELASLLGKPESYVMTCFAPTRQLTFAGTDDPCCLAEVANIGKLAPTDTARVSEALCKRLAAALSVPGTRIYIRFIDVERHMWGHDGHTFG